MIAVFGLALVIGVGLVLSAMSRNFQFFHNPSELLEPGFQPKSDVFRMGGYVLEGSIEKGEGTITTFKVIDFPEPQTQPDYSQTPIRVTFDGILPDLFQEGDGTVVTGQLNAEQVFVAEEVLAKHDENYQPVK